jgi:hypothetical protein
VPPGIEILEPAGNPGAVISGNTVTLTEPINAAQSRTLTFVAQASAGYSQPGFAVNASVSSGANTWHVGNASVALSDITLDVPAEIGFDGNNSEAFDVMVICSSAPGYTVSLEITSSDGKAAAVNRPLLNIPMAQNSLWIKETGIAIHGASAGIYTVTATLLDGSNQTVASTSKEMLVKAKPIRITGISLLTGSTTRNAPEPLTNMSYVTGNHSMDTNLLAMNPLTLTVNFADTRDIAEASMFMETSSGTFPGTVTRVASGFRGHFAAGAFKGSGYGTINLNVKLTDGTELNFTPARITFIIDPSGYVYDKDTGEPIEGATVTLQIMDEGGNWTDWDAENYAQHNPQTTDEEGRYGWFVPNGKYRVLVSAEWYLDYSTDVDEKFGIITVPPPRTDVDIGLTSSFQGTTFVQDGITYRILTRGETSRTVQVGDGTNMAVSPGTTSVTIPATVTYANTTYTVVGIGRAAFTNCLNLTTVTIPKSVTFIGDWAFAYCAKLQGLVLPNNLISIGEGAFNGCESLTEILLPGSQTSIGAWAFAFCSGLTSITIPDGVTSLGDWVFAYCAGLAEVVIGSGVTNISDSAFVNCGKLTNIEISPDNPLFLAVDGAIFNRDKTELISYPAAVGAYTVPAGVISISNNAFSSCSELTSIRNC